MFFSKVVAFAALPLLAVALPGGGGATTTVTVTAPASTETGSTCSTGSVLCCNTVTTAESGDASSILGLLGIVVSDVTALVGLDCSSITIIGLGGGSCSSNVVCCEDNSHDNLISIGCIPIIL